MAGESILVVDDNAMNLKLARILLEGKGYKARTAAEGFSGLKLAAEVRPDLILLDIQMPGIDGLEVARRLKDNPATSSIVVVALTAYAMKGDEERFRAAGCDGYITKPIDTAKFPGQVRAYLDLKLSEAQPARPAKPTVLVV